MGPPRSAENQPSASQAALQSWTDSKTQTCTTRTPYGPAAKAAQRLPIVALCASITSSMSSSSFVRAAARARPLPYSYRASFVRRPAPVVARPTPYFFSTSARKASGHDEETFEEFTAR